MQGYTRLTIARKLYREYTNDHSTYQDISDITEMMENDDITPQQIERCIVKLNKYIYASSYNRRCGTMDTWTSYYY